MAYYPPTHEARSPAAPGVANCSKKQLKLDHSYSKQSSAWARSRSDLILRKRFNASLYVIQKLVVQLHISFLLLPTFDFQIHDIGVRGGIQGRELFGDTSKQLEERWLSTL